MKLKKSTNTYLPKHIKRFHFSIGAYNIKTFDDLGKEEKERCIEWFDECAESLLRMKTDFIESHVLKPTETTQP